MRERGNRRGKGKGEKEKGERERGEEEGKRGRQERTEEEKEDKMQVFKEQEIPGHFFFCKPSEMMQRECLLERKN